jgi:pimeloyl-ACP methyl ester carboxylesterase
VSRDDESVASAPRVAGAVKEAHRGVCNPRRLDKGGQVTKPQTRYAKSGRISIAYQVFGSGPLDLVFVPGWISHLEFSWEQPEYARFLTGLGSFARVIMFDKRGTGLSDRDAGLPSLEERMDDVRAVMDTVGIERAAVVGASEGGNMSMLFAATYPERVSALVLCGCFAKRIWSHDYPWAPRPEERQRWFDMLEQGWGGVTDLETLAPSRSDDAAFADWWATFLRMGASPSAALSLARSNTQIDVRHVLPAIRVPTLVLHCRNDRDVKFAEGEYIASRIPGARFVALAGQDHLVWAGDQEVLLDEIQQFLTGARGERDIDRALTTILFTDIVGSTRRAVEVGDRNWHETLGQHHALVRAELARFRGHEINTAGDAFVASFDGPARSIRCALAIRDAVRSLGIEIRAGIHTGECHVEGQTLSGIALHIGARVCALGNAGDVLVSRTVKDLVAGAGISFEERGTHVLKGVPDEWTIFSVADAGSRR